MGDVKQFKRRAPTPVVEHPHEVPYLACSATCLACKHQWAATAPVATRTTHLECPNCHAYKGIMTQHVFPDCEKIYACTICSSHLWSICVKDAIAQASCAGCGKMTPLIEAFDQANGGFK